jgi:cation diffusion facilitator CzcD-associated flavoprotein CzcO
VWDGVNGRAPSIVIVGAGMSGLCMAVELLGAGIDSFTILEKADEVGGTWRENTYPGLTCDVPSPFYSYSFAPNPEWSLRFSPAAEIQRYLCSVADRFDLRRRIRFGTEVVEARYEDAGGWWIQTAAGEELTADVVVAATGVLHKPRLPAITGIGEFAGRAFHSARWDHSATVDRARIGVIGTGSTGVQIVTALAGRAQRLVQFQRTAQWVLPWPNQRYSGVRRSLLRRFPWLQQPIYRATQRSYDYLAQAVIKPGLRRSATGMLCGAHLRTVRDPELRARLTPGYEPFCKRLVISAGYYRAVQRPGVEVIADAIERIEPAGIRTADGRLHELDLIVFATGFDAHAFMRPMDVIGEGGLTLARAWSDGPRAHRTVALPGFPNLFLLMGPNSPIGSSSLIPIAEAQAGYVRQWIERLRSGEVTAVAPTESATAAFNAEIRANMGDTVWVTGCDSWYLGPDGYPTLWPFSMDRFRRMLARPDPREFTGARCGSGTRSGR